MPHPMVEGQQQVTGNSPVSSGEFDAPLVGVQSQVSGLKSPLGRLGTGEFWAAVGRYFTPPHLFTDRPASIPELSVYARKGAWTARLDGHVRTAGVWFWRLVGLPVTVACRATEWIFQRPGRVAALAALWALLKFTSYGAWFLDTVVSPIAQALAWVLL